MGATVLIHRIYRNTAEILRTANALVARDRFSDLDGLEELGERDVVCTRSGRPPVRVDAPSLTEHDEALVAALDRAVELVGVDHGDIAVLAARHKTLQHYQSVLRRHGVPFVDLENAIRIAKPESFWARRFYRDRKLAKAERRFGPEYQARRDRWRSRFGAGPEPDSEPQRPGPTSPQ